MSFKNHHHPVYELSKFHDTMDNSELKNRTRVRQALGVNPHTNRYSDSDSNDEDDDFNDSEAEEVSEEEEEELSEEYEEESEISDDEGEGESSDESVYERNSFTVSDNESSSSSESNILSDSDDDEGGDESEDSTIFFEKLKVDGHNFEFVSSDEEKNVSSSSSSSSSTTTHKNFTFTPCVTSVFRELSNLMFHNCIHEQKDLYDVNAIIKAASSIIPSQDGNTGKTVILKTQNEVYVKAFYYYIQLRQAVKAKLWRYIDEFKMFDQFLEKLTTADYAVFSKNSDTKERCFSSPELIESHVKLYKQSNSESPTPFYTFHYYPKYTPFISLIVWLWLYCRMINDEIVKHLSTNLSQARVAKTIENTTEFISQRMGSLLCELKIIIHSDDILIF